MSTTTSSYASYAFLALAAYLLFKLLKRYIAWHFSPLWKLPGPRHLNFWFGSAINSNRKPFFHDHQKWVKAAGPTADMIHYTGILGDHSLLILNCDLVKQIVFSPARKDLVYVRYFPVLIQMIGDGLITLKGEDWHRHRRMLHPAFNVSFLRDQMTRVVPPRVNRLMECWKQTAGQELDIASHFSMLTLDVIGQVGFSHDFQGMGSVEEWAKSCSSHDEDTNKLPAIQDKILQSMNKSFSPAVQRLMLYVLGLNGLDFEGKRVQAIMNEAVDDVIRNARAQLKDESITNGSCTTNGNSKSVLQLMMEAKDSEGGSTLSDAELRDEIKTFMVAGHETTSTWCYWALYLLTKHPDVQEKVYQDIARHSTSGEEITLEQIDKMNYLDAFLKEVLRLYPSVGVVIRHTVQEDTFKDVAIPIGTRINVPIFILHRSERYWDQPLECLPERWMDPDKPPHSHPYAYLPFSHGPRNCIGYRFATIEAKLILAPLIREFSFRLTPALRDTSLALKQRLSLRSVPEIKVFAQAR